MYCQSCSKLLGWSWLDEPETVRTIYDVFRHWTLLGSWTPPRSDTWLEEQDSVVPTSGSNVTNEQPGSTEGSHGAESAQEQWKSIQSQLSPEHIAKMLVRKVTIRKFFKNAGWFNGEIVNYSTERALYTVEFSDGEQAAMTLQELRRYMPSNWRPPSLQASDVSTSSEYGSGQKVRRSEEEEEDAHDQNSEEQDEDSGNVEQDGEAQREENIDSSENDPLSDSDSSVTSWTPGMECSL